MRLFWSSRWQVITLTGVAGLVLLDVLFTMPLPERFEERVVLDASYSHGEVRAMRSLLPLDGPIACLQTLFHDIVIFLSEKI
jgi:hypothetical protein